MIPAGSRRPDVFDGSVIDRLDEVLVKARRPQPDAVRLLTVGVVLGLNEVGPPPEKHRVTGVQQYADRGLQAFGPVIDRITAPAVPPPLMNAAGRSRVCAAPSCS
jgi:hypothetical protein